MGGLFGGGGGGGGAPQIIYVPQPVYTPVYQPAPAPVADPVATPTTPVDGGKINNNTNAQEQNIQASAGSTLGANANTGKPTLLGGS